MTHSPIYTHSQIISDGCIWGQLGVPRMPKQLEQPGIEMPTFQLKDNLLYLLSNSAATLFLVANVGDMLTFTQWQLSATESYQGKRKKKKKEASSYLSFSISKKHLPYTFTKIMRKVCQQFNHSSTSTVRMCKWTKQKSSQCFYFFIWSS